jgi:hypothetical protein
MLAKKFGFGFGIAVILPMLVHYGVSTFSPQPKWQHYYDNYQYQEYQNASNDQKKVMDQQRKEKDEEFRHKRKTFERRLFYAAVPTGLAAIVIGSFLSVQAIGAGLIFGGIFTLGDGYCWYWSELSDGMRFASLLAAFVVLVVIGYTKLLDRPGAGSLR